MEEEVRVTSEQVMQQLTMALQESKGRTEKQLEQLGQKLDQLTRDLITMEGTLRKELQTQFVTRAEYEPRHQIVLQRMAEFEQHVRDAEIINRQFIVTQADVKQLRVEADDMDSRMRGVGAKAVPWIAVAIALLSTIVGILQHIQFR